MPQMDAPRPRTDVRSKLLDLTISAALAGAFFVVFSKVYGCQQRLTELEKEMDDFKLMSSLQQLPSRMEPVVAPKDETLPSVVEEDLEEIDDAVEEVDDAVEEEEEETPPPVIASRPKRRPR